MYAVQSSDGGGERALPDNFCFSAANATLQVATGWMPLTLGSDGAYAASAISGDKNNANLRMLGQDEEVAVCIGVSGVSSSKVAAVLPIVARQKSSNTSLAGSNMEASVLLNFPATGEMTAFGPGLDASEVIRGEVRFVSSRELEAIFGPESGLTYVSISPFSWTMRPSVLDCAGRLIG